MFAPYMDLAAFILTLIVTIVLAIGVKESSRMNNVGASFAFRSDRCLFSSARRWIYSVWQVSDRDEHVSSAALSLVVIVVTGLSKANTNNWHISLEQIKQNASNLNAGKGGFLPYSISGVLSGAATCFYAFVGFDLVATTGEETENPRRAIPISICLVLLVCSVVYCTVAAVLTLMIPYYSIRADASLPDAFDRVGLSHVKVASKSVLELRDAFVSFSAD